MDICMAKPASGLMLGSDRRSVERTKKFPWNVCKDTPRMQKESGLKRPKSPIKGQQNRDWVIVDTYPVSTECA